MQHLKLGSTLLLNLIVDGTIFVGFLLATDPHATGQTIHEWLGIAFGAGIITHLLLLWKWIVNVARRFFRRLPGQVRINSLLNSLLFVTVTLIIFSGIMMSKVVLSTFSLSGSHNAIWRWLHSSSTDAALIIVGLHVALHWKWIASAVKRYVWQALSKTSVIPSNRDWPSTTKRNSPSRMWKSSSSVAWRWSGGESPWGTRTSAPAPR